MSEGGIEEKEAKGKLGEFSLECVLCVGKLTPDLDGFLVT